MLLVSGKRSSMLLEEQLVSRHALNVQVRHEISKCALKYPNVQSDIQVCHDCSLPFESNQQQQQQQQQQQWSSCQ